MNNYELVLGTETIKNFNFKCFEFIKKCKISIDFTGKESFWIRKLERQKHSMDIIYASEINDRIRHQIKYL